MYKKAFILQTSGLLMAAGLFVVIHAQQAGMTTLNTDSGLQTSGNWKTAQRILMHPTKNDFLKLEKGAGVLVGAAPASLQANLGGDDFVFQMEFMASPQAKATLQVPGGHTILLTNKWQSNQIDATVGGSTGQIAPLQNAQKAPGLWQKLRLQMRQARNGKPAQIEQMQLNGVLIQENIVMPNANNDPTLAVEINNGTVAVKNLAYQSLKDLKPLTLQNLSYQIYKGWAEKADQLKTENLLKKDTTSVLTQEWGAGMRNFAVVYEGTMNAQTTGLYIFELAYMGHLTFEIDGKKVLQSQWNEFSQKPVQHTLNLTQGLHSFRLHYNKAWRPASLGVFVAMPGVRPYALHALSSLPDPEPIPTIAVSANAAPEMVRSFVQIEGESKKRTHALSVGTPQGLHYTIDLNRGALLQFWKGQFADVTEMWYERGEPQLLKPLGLALTTKGQADVAPLADVTATDWPDSVVNITYKGYRIDPTGNPVLTYNYQNVSFTDAFVANGNGLTRTIAPTANPPQTLYLRLASGNIISLIDKGLYEVNNQSYYVQIKTGGKPILRNNNGQQELLLPLNAAVSYGLIW